MEIQKINIDEIIKEIINTGYKPGQLINYGELQELCKRLGRGLKEQDFAQRILGITHSNYRSCRYNGTNVRILKEQKNNLTKEELQDIINELKKAGYKSGQLINYSELQELYVNYGYGLDEMYFSERILGISQQIYRSFKYSLKRTKILENNNENKEYTKTEIIEKIKVSGYETGQLIDYLKLHELYCEYGNGFKEYEFAEKILGIKNENYTSCKNKNHKVRILKIDIIGEKTQQERKIIEQIKNRGYRPFQLISYEELHELYSEFGKGMKEYEFAEKILGIKYGNYNTCKNRGTRVRILKSEEKILSEDEIIEIREELKNAGYISGQLIDYAKLKELHKQYGRKTNEYYFAVNILNLAGKNYLSCKRRNTKVRILKSEEKVVSEDEILEILEELKNSGYKANQLINYEELYGIYKQFGRGLNIIEFAQKVLGLSYSNYEKCKNRGSRVRILKNEKITEEERQEILEKLDDAGYKVGQLINYEQLQRLCKQYGGILNEIEFAQSILGITYVNYITCKNKKAQLRIKNGIVIEKTREIIALYINKSQYYSKDDIKNICEEYGITIEDFITYVYIQNFYDVTPFKNSLENNGGLWIGKIRMSVDFANKNIERINQIAIRIAKYVCSKYRINQKTEDYKQDIIIYIIENMGDLEINLGDTDELFDIIGGKASKYCEGTIISKLKINNKYEGFYKTSRRGKEDSTFEVQYADESIDIESEVEEKLEGEIIDSSEEQMDKCINLLKIYIEKGMSKTDAIEKTARSMNIDAVTMLEYMQKYLLEKGKVKITKGKIIPVTPSGQAGEGR